MDRPSSKFGIFLLLNALLFTLLLLTGGCGGSLPPPADPLLGKSVLVLPFENLSQTPEAGRTLSSLFVSSLDLHRAMYLVSATPGIIKDISAVSRSGALPPALLTELSRERIDAVLFGVVTEYEYRRGLSTEPVVGFTWKMVSTLTGRTLWTGAVSRVDSCFWVCRDTLSSFGRALVDRAVERMLREGG
ncbi:MAG: hypothetical protein M1313_00025 [Nitrospirae bacterium]|jgi:hypothetical protein|nr:hypothetical protein [Nitrospirota bacterium]